ALDLLQSARVCANLDEALSGTTFSVALSARRRELSHAPIDARATAREVVEAASGGEVAIVFGNETVGLKNAEILRCTHLARIAAIEEYASLRLAQPVHIYAVVRGMGA